MKGGRGEDKAMDPLFPKLHVSDTGKVDPRAPPRNKMALFEQLSVPSQCSNVPGPSTRPLPPHTTTNTLVPSASSSQGCGHERSTFSPFYLPPQIHAYSGDKVHTRSSDGKNVTTLRAEMDAKSDKHATQRTYNASGHFRAAAETSLLSPYILTRMKDSDTMISEDEDDFRVPTFGDSRIVPSSNKDSHVVDRKKPAAFQTSSPKLSAARSSSIQLPVCHEKLLESPRQANLKSGMRERSNVEQKDYGTAVYKNDTKKSAMVKVDISETSKERSKHECKKHSLNDIDNSQTTRTGQESTCNGTLGGPKYLTDIEFMDKSEISGVRSISCLKMSLGSNVRSPNLSEDYNEESKSKEPRSLPLGDARRDDELSETSMVDFVSGLDISPDDVVGVIGPKHFWKARRAIVHQQRLFAVQVFELHRLIKVQKLIAASPHLLLKGDYLSMSQPKIGSKTLASKLIGQSPQVAKHTNALLREKNECTTENIARRSPLPSNEDTLSKGPDGQVPINGHYIGSSTPVPLASDYKSNAWCFQPQGNQWLIPVMSPLEGLIYKPYTGSCPPASGFMAPVYPPAMGKFMNSGYGVHASQQHQNIGVFPEAPVVAPNYFPPCGLPVANPIISNSGTEQVRPLAGAHCNGQPKQLSQSSCNVSMPKCEALNGNVWMFQTSKSSELQGSTASSPCERVLERGHALPPFPMVLAKEGSSGPVPSHDGDYQTNVIKVVPHNPRSATESAARIFQSIQKERQQYDSI